MTVLICRMHRTVRWLTKSPKDEVFGHNGKPDGAFLSWRVL